MNNTPTPRTDAAAWPETDLVEGNFARILERELTAVTEQRDGLRSGIDYASDQLTRVTEQRDRLAEAIRKHKFCDVELYEALQSLNQNAPAMASADEKTPTKETTI